MYDTSNILMYLHVMIRISNVFSWKERESGTLLNRSNN